MKKITFSPRLSLSHSRACCNYPSQNHNQAKQKSHEVESSRVPPKLRAGPKPGRKSSLGGGTSGAGRCEGEERSRSDTPTPGRERVWRRGAGPGLPLHPARRFPVPLLPWGRGWALCATSAPRQGRSPSPCAWRLPGAGAGAGRGAWRGARRLRLLSILSPSPTPAAPALRTTAARPAMSAAKHRGSKGGSPPSANEKGAQPGGAEEPPAKKPAAAGHGRGGRAGGGGRSGAGPRRGWAMLLGAAVVLGAALPAGWYVLQLQEEVGRSAREVEASGRQRQELAATLDTVVQKVRSLQTTFGEFESMMKIVQQKQEVSEKAVKQGESEINRISEVLQKLQNEILKDLSDGIHMVKDARERDFTSLENTVEERLTELTKSINDNIAVFTEVQQRSQDEINNMKIKVGSLEQADVYKHEIKVLKDAFDEMQASMKVKEKDIETLKSTIDSMESDVYTEVKELVNLKQEHEKFKEAADTEHLSLKALQEKVLRAEDSIMQLPSDIKRLDEDLLQIKANLNKWEDNELFRKALETSGKNSEGLESRLRHIEDSLESLASIAAQNSEKLESFLSKEADYENKLNTLEQSIATLQGLSNTDVTSVTDTLKNLGEAQTSLYNDLEDLRRSISDLPSSGALQDIQKQISTLSDQGNLQAGQAHSQGYLEKFSSMEGSVDELRSSVSQVDSDLKIIRTAVDSLVAYSVKIENNENNLESVKSSIDDLRNDLERLFVKVEKIHEKV
ncbi:LOW QUALITY PROTEIN: cytoskeleton-associated protein 4 [Prinia subflava]|uniref:LOW QUALITY PROTEIN: cytoskeleton-associated protein 4 n=1 Tax=Prinia subflava TaxID=208062 RepID=UPI002FE3762E